MIYAAATPIPLQVSIRSRCLLFWPSWGGFGSQYALAADGESLEDKHHPTNSAEKKLLLMYCLLNRLPGKVHEASDNSPVFISNPTLAGTNFMHFAILISSSV